MTSLPLPRRVAMLSAHTSPLEQPGSGDAGGAIGLDPVESADPDDWRSMYETNVIGTLQVTRALLPALEASGAGTVVNIGSTAGRIAYEGGGGMVRTEEFALTRFDGDTERADAVYRGVDEPLTADDVADVVAWVATRPQHVNVDLVVVKPIAQASQHKVHRTS
ncbi:SDR family NAD(P)-dependent oxidoreductase [Aeromicrobium sp. REDSEA-S32_B7]|uniref:SDR family NAD(P)-dependent oxidoreductase n=1 Tax=Aeromicrobium sp. REDSEA-S32_B7 TaxID=1811526 RepID=UPI000A7FB945|nr:SDR family NAD(P)-dependent oxidoreductase [Aeromicrobium sp. REDSEA-S32_B7]